MPNYKILIETPRSGLLEAIHLTEELVEKGYAEFARVLDDADPDNPTARSGPIVANSGSTLGTVWASVRVQETLADYQKAKENHKAILVSGISLLMVAAEPPALTKTRTALYESIGRELVGDAFDTTETEKDFAELVRPATEPKAESIDYERLNTEAKKLHDFALVFGRRQGIDETEHRLAVDFARANVDMVRRMLSTVISEMHKLPARTPVPRSIEMMFTYARLLLGRTPLIDQDISRALDNIRNIRDLEGQNLLIQSACDALKLASEKIGEYR